MPPYLAQCLTLISSKYPCLEHIFMVPKMFEPLKYDFNGSNIFGTIKYVRDRGAVLRIIKFQFMLKLYHGLSACMGDNPSLKRVDYLPYRWIYHPHQAGPRSAIGRAPDS